MPMNTMSTYLSRDQIRKDGVPFLLDTLGTSDQERSGLLRLMQDPDSLGVILDNPSLVNALYEITQQGIC